MTDATRIAIIVSTGPILTAIGGAVAILWNKLMEILKVSKEIHRLTNSGMTEIREELKVANSRIAALEHAAGVSEEALSNTQRALDNAKKRPA
jgi:hypothetical protein